MPALLPRAEFGTCALINSVLSVDETLTVMRIICGTQLLGDGIFERRLAARHTLRPSKDGLHGALILIDGVNADQDAAH
jgi:hypothetical protein